MECTEKTGVLDFGFSGQGEIPAWRDPKEGTQKGTALLVPVLCAKNAEFTLRRVQSWRPVIECLYP